MSDIELNLEEDIDINVSDLTREFKRLPSLIYRYSEMKAEADEEYGVAKAELAELKSIIYCQFKKSEEKYTVNHLDAMVESHEDVIAQKRIMLKAKRDADTIKGYLDGITSKESMLIQLGASSRVV